MRYKLQKGRRGEREKQMRQDPYNVLIQAKINEITFIFIWHEWLLDDENDRRAHTITRVFYQKSNGRQ